MDHYRLLILAVVFVARQTVKGETDGDHAPTGNLKGDESERSVKLKRELSIVGPIPSSYRGQASGRTTFDGIRTGDLQLPSREAPGFRREPQQFGGGLGFGQQPSKSSFSSNGFGSFTADSAPDVYNFDGKEPVTYDGVLASDLMVPLPHVSSRISPVLFTQPAIGRTGSGRQEEPISSASPEGLALPALNTVQQVFNSPNTPEPFNHQLRDASLFTPETPIERYNRLQEEYQIALEEYRQSLARYRQLQKFTLSRHKK